MLFGPIGMLQRMGLVPSERGNFPLVIAELVVTYTAPQVLAAWMGGRLAARCWPTPKPE